MGIHPALHNRRVRRAHGRPAARGYRLPSVHRQAARAGGVPGPGFCVPASGLLAPDRPGRPRGGQGVDAAAHAHPARGHQQGEGDAVRGGHPEVAGAGAVQGQGHIRQRRDDQAEAEEDQVREGISLKGGICVGGGGCCPGTVRALYRYLHCYYGCPFDTQFVRSMYNTKDVNMIGGSGLKRGGWDC